MRVVNVASVAMDDIVDYRCTSCHHTAKVFVVARGHAEIDAGFTRAADAQSRDLAALGAELDAHRAIDEAVELAACPQCKARDRGAKRRALLRRLGLSVGIGAVGSIFGLFIGMQLEKHPLIAMGIAAVAITLVVWALRYVQALRAADRIEFLTDADARRLAG